MKVKYRDFEGNELEVDADVSVDLQTGIINSKLSWEEMKLVLRSDGRVVGRKSLCYREVKKDEQWTNTQKPHGTF